MIKSLPILLLFGPACFAQEEPTIKVDVNLVNNKVYVTNGRGLSVTIIDGNTNQILQTLPIPASFPGGVAVNQATGLVYVADFGSNNVVVLQPN